MSFLVSASEEKEMLLKLNLICEYSQKKCHSKTYKNFLMEQIEEAFNENEKIKYDGTLADGLRLLVDDSSLIIRLPEVVWTIEKDYLEIDIKDFVTINGRVYPRLVYIAFTLHSNLPGALKICAAPDCDNVFASMHKRKIFCSGRCRGRFNTQKSRHRFDQKLKLVKK